ncbi:hypothetical protein [Metamycoplasma alkalescens]|uniref:Exonuclease domain-containing protein n=3 Tax=Metamycoplasma alkalescens TaxID=45363 RepID=A0A318U4M2_9BACT|nr:hypothetical protein [Metamycoplasma alkalescens]PYF42619.1 hypothetical protein BCF88_10825 [Metamycoplasma alkalescens]
MNNTFDKSNIDRNQIEFFAVIDIEINEYRSPMSIGVVIAESINFDVVAKKYWIIAENVSPRAMFYYELTWPLRSDQMSLLNKVEAYNIAINQIIEFLLENNVNSWFSYTDFDYRYLPELKNFFHWFDISRIARNIQYNKSIPSSYQYFKNNLIKSGWGVQNMYRLLSNDSTYFETHNALIDAEDELEIMRMLQLTLNSFKELEFIERKNSYPRNEFSYAHEINKQPSIFYNFKNEDLKKEPYLESKKYKLLNKKQLKKQKKFTINFLIIFVFILFIAIILSTIFLIKIRN